MRQISILLLMCFSVAAAPSTREQVNKQLNSIIIPKVGDLRGFQLDELIEVLSKISNNKINFLYIPHRPKPKIEPLFIPTNNIPQLGFDPNGLPQMPPNFNQPLPVLPPMQPEVKENKIPEMKITTSELNNLTIKQFMEIIVMGCQPPIQYVIMDYGVVFLPQEDEKKAYMPIRLFRLNGNPFRLDKQVRK